MDQHRRTLYRVLPGEGTQGSLRGPWGIRADPGDEPPGIECNEDGGQELIDG